MALKDLLVLVDHARQSVERITVAALLAERHDAHLAGLFTIAPPDVPVYIAGQMPSDVMELQRSTARALADEAAAAFDAQMRRSGLEGRSEWRVLEGDPTMVATLHGRVADLIVAGQFDPSGEQAGPVIRPEDLVLGTGRPVLIVPHSGSFETVGERAIVAWNGSREVARAVNDALPLLRMAEKVVVVAANPSPISDQLGEDPGADIALHLARHGVAVETSLAYGEDIDPGDLLLNAVVDYSADLIVMGGYGRSRLRETLLGGVTRHILQHMTVPVLMSH